MLSNNFFETNYLNQELFYMSTKDNKNQFSGKIANIKFFNENEEKKKIDPFVALVKDMTNDLQNRRIARENNDNQKEKLTTVNSKKSSNNSKVKPTIEYKKFPEINPDLFTQILAREKLNYKQILDEEFYPYIANRLEKAIYDFVFKRTLAFRKTREKIKISEFYLGSKNSEEVIITGPIDYCRASVEIGIALAKERKVILTYQFKNGEPLWFFLNTPENQVLIEKAKKGEITEKDLIIKFKDEKKQRKEKEATQNLGEGDLKNKLGRPKKWVEATQNLGEGDPKHTPETQENQEKKNSPNNSYNNINNKSINNSSSDQETQKNNLPENLENKIEGEDEFKNQNISNQKNLESGKKTEHLAEPLKNNSSGSDKVPRDSVGQKTVPPGPAPSQEELKKFDILRAKLNRDPAHKFSAGRLKFYIETYGLSNVELCVKYMESLVSSGVPIHKWPGFFIDQMDKKHDYLEPTPEEKALIKSDEKRELLEKYTPVFKFSQAATANWQIATDEFGKFWIDKFKTYNTSLIERTDKQIQSYYSRPDDKKEIEAKRLKIYQIDEEEWFNIIYEQEEKLNIEIEDSFNKLRTFINKSDFEFLINESVKNHPKLTNKTFISDLFSFFEK